MTLEQAFSVLNQMARRAVGNADEHELRAEATRTLAQHLAPPVAEEAQHLAEEPV